MLSEAVEADLDEMMQLTEELLPEGLFVYLNLRNFGLGHSNVQFWLVRADKTEALLGIVMRYFWGVTVISRDDSAVLEPLVDLVNRIEPRVVQGRLALIELVNDKLRGVFDLERGWVFNLSGYRFFETSEDISRATREELPEVAEFLFGEEVTRSHYPDPESLAFQFKERFDDGSGCNYILRKDGKIIAHIGSYAKGHGIGTTSGLYVNENYRDAPSGTFLESHLVAALKSEGRVPYTFSYTRKRKKLLDAVGAEVCCEHGILTKTE